MSHNPERLADDNDEPRGSADPPEQERAAKFSFDLSMLNRVASTHPHTDFAPPPFYGAAAAPLAAPRPNFGIMSASLYQPYMHGLASGVLPPALGFSYSEQQQQQDDRPARKRSRRQSELSPDGDFEYRNASIGNFHDFVQATERAVTRNSSSKLKDASFSHADSRALSDMAGGGQSPKKNNNNNKRKKTGERYVWNHFFKRRYAKLREEKIRSDPDYTDVRLAFKALSRELGEEWRKLSSEERAEWKAKADAASEAAREQTAASDRAPDDAPEA